MKLSKPNETMKVTKLKGMKIIIKKISFLEVKKKSLQKILLVKETYGLLNKSTASDQVCEYPFICSSKLYHNS